MTNLTVDLFYNNSSYIENLKEAKRWEKILNRHEPIIFDMINDVINKLNSLTQTSGQDNFYTVMTD